MSMAQQFGRALPRPVQVWVLDALPGKVSGDVNGNDHPRHVIRALQDIPLPISSKAEVTERLLRKGGSVGRHERVHVWVLF